MTDEDDLAAIEKWCAEVLARFERGFNFDSQLCEYTDDLPTHSIRFTVASLSKDLRDTRTALRQLLAAQNRFDSAEDHYQDCHGGHVHPAKMCDGCEKNYDALEAIREQARVLVSDAPRRTRE